MGGIVVLQPCLLPSPFGRQSARAPPHACGNATGMLHCKHHSSRPTGAQINHLVLKPRIRRLCHCGHPTHAHGMWQCRACSCCLKSAATRWPSWLGEGPKIPRGGVGDDFLRCPTTAELDTRRVGERRGWKGCAAAVWCMPMQSRDGRMPGAWGCVEAWYRRCSAAVEGLCSQSPGDILQHKLLGVRSALRTGNWAPSASSAAMVDSGYGGTLYVAWSFCGLAAGRWKQVPAGLQSQGLAPASRPPHGQ